MELNNNSHKLYMNNYSDNDFIKLYDFLDFGHALKRHVAVLTTPGYAKKIKKEKIESLKNASYKIKNEQNLYKFLHQLFLYIPHLIILVQY